jgi:hypothetical protein
MTPEQFRFALIRLDLSQVGAASLFAVDERTARRWASGERPVPASVSIALRLMLRFGVDAESAARLR